MDDFSFFDSSSPFYFLLIKFHILFAFLIKYYHLMFIILVFRLGSYKLFMCFFALLLLSLPRDQSRDVTPRFGVLVFEKCTLFRFLASSFWLLLLRLGSNRCAETLVVYRNSLLNRLTAV